MTHCVTQSSLLPFVHVSEVSFTLAHQPFSKAFTLANERESGWDRLSSGLAGLIRDARGNRSTPLIEVFPWTNLSNSTNQDPSLYLVYRLEQSLCTAVPSFELKQAEKTVDKQTYTLDRRLSFGTLFGGSTIIWANRSISFAGHDSTGVPRSTSILTMPTKDSVGIATPWRTVRVLSNQSSIRNQMRLFGFSRRTVEICGDRLRSFLMARFWRRLFC